MVADDVVIDGDDSMVTFEATRFEKTAAPAAMLASAMFAVVMTDTGGKVNAPDTAKFCAEKFITFAKERLAAPPAMFASDTLMTLNTVLLMSIPPVMLMLVQFTDWNFVVPDTDSVPVTFALSTFIV
jgi:hypothetical protein